MLTLKDFIKLFLAPYVVFMFNEFVDTIAPHWYSLVQLDNYMHFFGGLAIGYSAYHTLVLAERFGWVKFKKQIIKIFLVVAMVAFAAVLWECYEFWHDYFFASHMQPSNADTMKDLMLGVLGGIVGNIVIFLFPKKPSAH